MINGLVTSNNKKVLNSDILHSYDSDETVEANARNSVKDTILTLGKNDVLVFSGGANDISKNNSKMGLRHILNFVSNNTHTHVK
jgi:hypothetical protein